MKCAEVSEERHAHAGSVRRGTRRGAAGAFNRTTGKSMDPNVKLGNGFETGCSTCE